ncbi:MAG: hypothetical protein ACRDJE_05925 [Dehalococcoidia bacterium]
MAETIRRLRPGEPAPTPEVRGPDGPVSLGSAWADGPVVVVFLRHFG